MIVRDLIANHGHNIGHRRLVQGEVWCRMQFRDERDLTDFAATLRWSAFRLEEPKQAPAAPAEAKPADPPKRK
jgi:hypothetical protein